MPRHLIPKLADSDSCCRRFYQDIHCKNIQTSNGILVPRSAQTMAPMSQHLRRLVLALAAIYDGATRTEAAKIGGVGLQIIRDWVLRFNARGPDGLLDGKSTGQPSKLNDTQRQAIARMIESGPIPAVHGVVRWHLS